MKTFKQHLKEGKQLGLLYHVTSLYNTISILKSNKMLGGIYKAVSFSRNKRYTGWNPKDHQVKITFDGDGLSNVFKINPYKGPRATPKEDEERILTDKNNEIKNIKKYIKSIELFNTYDIASFPWHEETFPKRLKELKSLSKGIKIIVSDKPNYTRGYGK